jgi:hypothetical protein
MSEEDALLEDLAELEHLQWQAWRKKLEEEHPDVPKSPYLAMSYSQLPESEKEADRKWAREVIKLLNRRKKAGANA